MVVDMTNKYRTMNVLPPVRAAVRRLAMRQSQIEDRRVTYSEVVELACAAYAAQLDEADAIAAGSDVTK
jgi:hypothetical protein